MNWFPGLLSLVVAAVATESTSWSKFAKLVTYHVFSDIDRDELITIVYGESVAYEFRSNHRSA